MESEAGPMTEQTDDAVEAESPDETPDLVDELLGAAAAAEAESPAEGVVLITDIDVLDGPAIMATLSDGRTIIGLDPAEPPPTAAQIDAEDDAASVRRADIRTAGRLRRSGRAWAAREVMQASLERQAEILGIPTAPSI